VNHQRAGTSRVRGWTRALGVPGLLLALVAVPTSANAALPGLPGTGGAADKPAETTQAAPPSEAIPAAMIPARAAAAEAAARTAVERARGRDGDASLDRAFTQLEANVEEFRGSAEMQRLDRLSLTRLEMLQRQWRFYAAELDALQRQMARRTAALSAGAAELKQMQGVWLETVAAGDRLPEPLRQRAAGVVTMLTEAERVQSGPLSAALDLQQRVSRETARVARGQRQVEDALAYADERLFYLDEPPLWARAAPAVGDDVVLRPLQREQAFVREYFAAHPQLVRGWIATSVLLLGLVMWLRRRSRDWLTSDNDLRDTARLLLRPWSAWLLLSLLAALFVFALAPSLFLEATLLALVLPLVRLLPGWLMKGSRWGLYVVAGLFVLERLRYLSGHGEAFRYSLLFVSTLGAIAMGWTAWRLRRGITTITGFWARTARAASAVGALLLSAAVVANVIGNVTLADLLTRATITAAFTAILLLAGAAVLRGVVALLLSTPLARRLRMVEHHGDVVMRYARRLVTFVAAASWLVVTLADFRLMQPVIDDVRAVLAAEARIGQVSLSLGSVLLFVVCVYAAYKFARLVRFVIDEELLSRVGWPRGVGSTVSTLTFYAVAGLGFLVALSAAGVEIGNLAIVAGALGVGIGFGLQTVVNNFVSGLILMFERPIQPGDIVEVSGITGTVKSIGLRATTIETFEGAEVIVPNGTLLQGNLTNWTLNDRNRRIEIPVGVAYGTDPNVVLGILRDVAARQPLLLRHPAPVALFTGFGESSLDFSLRFWTSAGDTWGTVRSAAMVEICDALAKAGIEIPFPQRDLHVRSIAPAATPARTPDTAAQPDAAVGATSALERASTRA
jgi:small-conductance mechanosensitive channel